MRTPILPRPTLAPAALTLVAAGLAAASVPSSGDYMPHSGAAGDNSGPALLALIHGQPGAFLTHQPLMGLTSLLLRLPVTAAAYALGAGDLTAYRWGVFACLLPCALLVAWLLSAAGRDPRRLIGAALVGAIVLAGPLTRNALENGHPEDLLAAGLAVSAVLLACAGRPRWAGLALGCAVGSKQWAVLAVVPVLIALPRRRREAVGCALASGIPLALGAGLADPSALSAAARTFGSTHLVNSLSAWWPVSVRPPGLGAPGTAELPAALTKSQALVVVLLAGIAVQLVLWRVAHRTGRRLEPLGLLALGGLFRAAGDPGPIEYYLVALMVPLAVWEAGPRRRLPLLAVLASLAANESFTTRLGAPALNTLTLVWYSALGGWLAFEASGGSLSLPRGLAHPLKANSAAPIRRA